MSDLVMRAAVEVDGFRVGDLVRWSGLIGDACAMSGGARWRPISSFDGPKASYEGSVRNGYPTSKLTRKPVEVGDTVRCKGVDRRGKVLRVEGGGNDEPFWVVRVDEERNVYWRMFDVVAVAP